MLTFEQRIKNFYNNQRLFAVLLIITAALMLIFGLFSPIKGEKLSLFSIIFYIYILFSGGNFYSSYFSEKKLIQHFIYGSAFGGIIYFVSFINRELDYNTLITSSLISGIYCILVALVYSVKDLKIRVFVINIKYLFLVIAFVLIDFKLANSGIIAHVAGMLLGFIVAPNSKILFTIKHWMNKDIFTKSKKNKTKKNNYEKQKAPKSDDEYYKQKNEEQKEIDRILDKISEKGYDKLTKEEKGKLFRHGQ